MNYNPNPEKLERCPFCTGADNLKIIAFGLEDIGQKPEDRDHAVVCDDCGGSGPEVAPRSAAIAAWNRRDVLKTEGGQGPIFDQICHKEQLGIWSNEIATAISLGDFLKENWTFDDSVDLDREIAAQLKDIIASVLTHPGFNVTERIKELESALEPFSTVPGWPDPGAKVMIETVESGPFHLFQRDFDKARALLSEVNS